MALTSLVHFLPRHRERKLIVQKVFNTPKIAPEPDTQNTITLKLWQNWSVWGILSIGNIAYDTPSSGITPDERKEGQ